MLKWFSGEEGQPGSSGPGSPCGAAGGGQIPVEEMSERLTQTEQLVTQLKEMIRDRDCALRSKHDQLQVEKEAYEAKLSKLRLQNKAKVASLTAQLEKLKKQGDHSTPTHSKKSLSEGEQASRGKIVLLKKKVDELEQQLAQRNEELENKKKELECKQQRAEEMDIILTEKNKSLSEKEAYIVHLQTGLVGVQPVTPVAQQKVAEGVGEVQDFHMLVQSLTKKVEEAEERYSLLQAQMDSLKDLMTSEREQYSQKDGMYKQNIQTFKDIIIQKDSQLMEINKMHERELFRLAAKSDASADLEQLLKALKQKLHEKEEVLFGKAQVIDVLQGEVDSKDQQIKELMEQLHWLQIERENLESKLEAEKHVMRAQLRDLMEKHQVEVQRMTGQHRAQMDQLQQDLSGQLEELRRASLTSPSVNQQATGGGNLPTDSVSIQMISELEAQAKQKTEEASRSEAKFLKIKAWSKSRIKQLEGELKKSQAGAAPPDLTVLRSRIKALEEEREENVWKAEQYEKWKTKSEVLEAKLVLYEEQQRTLQAELEQFTKRAASQASESGSADDAQCQVLEWQEMVAEAISARDRTREEKAVMALRISHMEEEREALATRQRELEEELAQVQGLGQHRAKKLSIPAQRSLQEDFAFDAQAPFPDLQCNSENTIPMDGDNMGAGLRCVVEELELERNQLQEQILSLEEQCKDLEDRLQLQARIETLQSETEKLQSQLASVKIQQNKDAEKHQLLVNSLNEQLQGLTDTQECLESSLIEKENTLARTSEKLELINGLREALSQKEIQCRGLSDKLLQATHSLENSTKNCSSFENQCSELKTEVADLKQKLSVMKDKVLRLKADKLQQTAHRDFSSYQEETIHLRSDAEMKDSLPVKETTVSADHCLQEEVVHRLEVERIQLCKDLQHCFHEIQQRDQYIQHLNSKLQQAIEEKATIAAQLRSVSQSLQDTQDCCHWLEHQTPGQVQGSVNAEVAPLAPQERSNTSITSDSAEASQLRERLLELDLILADERARRETAEEALRLAEDRTKTLCSSLSGDIQRDFSIEMETEEEWEALSLNPNQPLITQKMKGGMAACRRWLRGRSLYFSKLLTSRTRSRYFFLAYLLMIHVIAVLCLTGYL